jgi:hypothetical protein
VNDVRWPSELLDRFQCSLAEEYGSQCVIIIPLILFVLKHVFPLEHVLIVQKVNLKAGVGQGGDLDLQGIVVVVDGYIDAGEADYFMKPMPALIDDTETGHDASHFVAVLIGLNGQSVGDLREFGELQVRRHLIGNEQNPFLCYHSGERFGRVRRVAKVRIINNMHFQAHIRGCGIGNPSDRINFVSGPDFLSRRLARLLHAVIILSHPTVG